MPRQFPPDLQSPYGSGGSGRFLSELHTSVLAVQSWRFVSSFLRSARCHKHIRVYLEITTIVVINTNQKKTQGKPCQNRKENTPN